MTTATINTSATTVAKALDLTFTTAKKFCEAADEFGIEVEVALAFWSNRGLYGMDLTEDLEDMMQTAQDAYQGTFETVEDYAYDYIEQAGMLAGVPEVVARYFDYDAFARDLVLGGDIAVVELGYKNVVIFDNHI